MSSQDFEELKRELVEDKLRRYDSSNKECKYEDRLAIKKASAQPSQKDRHPSLLRDQETRRHQ